MILLLAVLSADDDFGYWKRLCGRGDTGSCCNLSVSCDNACDVKQDYFKAFEYFKMACDDGYFAGCSNLGVVYAKGQGVKQDKSIAKKYFSKACDLKFQASCNAYKKLNMQGY
ncbi:MAG: sel1 repeat family protein [Campylobacteraceae bacterium]|nr:sel1 repeat family protein [Campylobacteraceae bacterium]